MAAAIKIESYQKTNTKVNYISVKFLPLNATPLGVNLLSREGNSQTGHKMAKFRINKR